MLSKTHLYRFLIIFQTVFLTNFAMAEFWYIPTPMPSVQDRAQHRYNQDHERKNHSGSKVQGKEQSGPDRSPLRYNNTPAVGLAVAKSMKKTLLNETHPQFKPLMSGMLTDYIPGKFSEQFLKKPNYNVGYIIGAYQAVMDSIANGTTLTDERLKAASENAEKKMVKRNQLTSAGDTEKQTIAETHMYNAVFFYRAHELALEKKDKKMLDTVRNMAKQSLDNMRYTKG